MTSPSHTTLAKEAHNEIVSTLNKAVDTFNKTTEQLMKETHSIVNEKQLDNLAEKLEGIRKNLNDFHRAGMVAITKDEIRKETMPETSEGNYPEPNY